MALIKKMYFNFNFRSISIIECFCLYAIEALTSKLNQHRNIPKETNEFAIEKTFNKNLWRDTSLQWVTNL